MFRQFLSDRRGNFALITAIAMLPMILAIGFAIDGARYYKARSHLQDAVDTASLAVAASEEQDTKVLRTMAEEFIRSNLDESTIDNVNFDWFTSSPEEITAGVHGSITTSFMQLANVKTMSVSVSTVAKRAPKQIVEIALVLDNTYSMSAPDAKTGETRIETLRKASKSLVETLLPTDDPGTLSIALVPYADHVNVGIENKNQNWLALDGAERTETGGGDRMCGPKVENGTETYCKKYSTKSCTSIVDGITVTSTCNDQCIEQGTRTAYKQTCTGKDPYSNTYKFYGCVGTRIAGSLRLSDTSPTSKYPAYVETSQRCARPIIPLMQDRKTLLAGVAAMTHQPSNYVANTHIPSGMVWGLNVLSPMAPFSEAEEYDPDNKSPRKILILMTDGDNTLKPDTSRGKHIGFDSKDANKAAADFINVNKDTADICTNAKAKGIEIYTVAFAVTKVEAKALLRQCATSDAYYYDATDAAKLASAFSGIARAISQVRLSQ